MKVRKSYLLLASVTVWILLGRLLNGTHTLQIATYENTAFTSYVGEKALDLRGNRT